MKKHWYSRKIQIGEQVRRNPNYVGGDHSPDGLPHYYEEIGVVERFSTRDYPIVEFPSTGLCGYEEWEQSLIRLGIMKDGTNILLEELGFNDDLFKID